VRLVVLYRIERKAIEPATAKAHIPLAYRLLSAPEPAGELELPHGVRVDDTRLPSKV